jgi:hypothetical protein
MKRPLQDQQGARFISMRDSEGSYAYRFTWTTEVFATRVDEEGELQTERIITQSFLDFVLKNVGKKTLLRIRNPGRTVTNLLNALEAEVGFGFWVKPVELLPYADELLKGSARKTDLIGLKITNVAISENILSRMEFVSKQSIDRAQIQSMLSRTHTLEFSSYEIYLESHKGQISFMRTGLIKVSQQLEKWAIEVIEGRKFIAAHAS